MVTKVQSAPTDAGTDKWWPSRYGADDQAGALNEITPAKLLEAVRLVRRGRVYDLAHVLHQDIPAFPGRTFRQYLTTNYHQINRRHPDAGPAGLGHNSVNWIVEQVTATQQMGTHMDGLNHLQMGDRTYNGFLLADIVEDHGTSRLGIDTLPQVVTRGLLIDVMASRGGDRLQPGEVITVADVEQALAVTGHDVRPGDAVFFHTGWGTLWGTDNERYASGEPGPGLALAEWLAGHRVALTGCDTWSFGPYPPESRCQPFVVPQTLNVRHGVVVVENLRLDQAAHDRLHEFLLVISHAKLRGATGAWVAPLAIESAGGYLASLTGLSDPRVRAVVDQFGASDLSRAADGFDRRMHAALANPRHPIHRYRATEANPIDLVRPGAPAFLLMHGDDDRIISPTQTLALHQALCAAGADSTRYLLAGAGHGRLARSRTQARQWTSVQVMTIIKDFLDGHLHG